MPGNFAFTPASLGALLDAGTQTLSASFVPNDSIDSTTAVVSTTITVAKATPTINVTDPSGTFDGSPFAASVTIVGTNNIAVGSLGGITPTRTYYDGSSASGTSLGSTAPTAAGTYTVVADFPGNADYLAVQSASVTFTIETATPTIALTSSGGSTVYGQAVTLIATAASGAGTPSGSVTFLDGGTPLGTMPLNGSGKATLTTTNLPVGLQSISATYSGAPSFSGVQSGLASESVARASTVVVLVPHPVLKKKTLVTVGLTAEIQPQSPGGGTPTGMVAFELVTKKKKKTKTKVVGTAPLSGGQSTLSLKSMRVLNSVITIICSGDTDFRASTLTSPKLTKKALGSLALSPRTVGLQWDAAFKS